MIITKAFLNQKYNELYAKVIAFNKKVSLCETRLAKCESCETILTSLCNGYASGNSKLCCQGFDNIPACRFCVPNKGCRVKSIRCELWFCSEDLLSKGQEPLNLILIQGIYYPTGTRINSCFMIINEEHRVLINEAKMLRFMHFFRAPKKIHMEHAYHILVGRNWETTVRNFHIAISS